MIHEHHYGRYNVSIDTDKLLNGIPVDKRLDKVSSEPEKTVRNSGWLHSITSESTQHIDKKIDIIMESSSIHSCLERFCVQIDELIHEISDEYGGILNYTELWEGISIITIMMETGKLSELMMRIAYLPQVERVEDGWRLGETPESVEGLIGLSPYSRINTSGNAIRVILNEEVISGY